MAKMITKAAQRSPIFLYPPIWIPHNSNGPSRPAAILNTMAESIDVSSRSISEALQKPLHTHHQIRIRRLQTQMVVVAHQNPCVQPPSLRHARLEQTVQKAFTRSHGWLVTG